MNSKYLMRCVVLVVLSMLSAAAFAESRVAFVDADKVVENSPQYEAARAAIQKEFSRRENDLLSKQKYLKKLEAKAAKNAAIMSESEVKRLERDIITRRRQLKNAKQEFREDLTLRQNEEFNKLRRQVIEVIKEVGKEKNLDLVFSVGVVYANKRVDISDQVLKRLRKRFKKKR
ncbi:MAG TPA: OmpH family outer membrane protein [Chromatiaceae bacterium]|nr:OmpH family outer membrane protein [Chromatiaceae bacterium]